jgi:hypothetical protein
VTEPQQKVELNMLLDSIDAPRALVILVDESGQIETADKNLGLENVMIVCFSLAYEIAQKIKADHHVEPRPLTHNRKPVLYLPPDLQRKLDEL